VALDQEFLTPRPGRARLLCRMEDRRCLSKGPVPIGLAQGKPSSVHEIPPPKRGTRVRCTWARVSNKYVAGNILVRLAPHARVRHAFVGSPVRDHAGIADPDGWLENGELAPKGDGPKAPGPIFFTAKGKFTR